MTTELKTVALELAVEFAGRHPGTNIVGMAGDFYAFLTGDTAPTNTAEDKPATRRRAKAEPEAAAEQTADKPALVADEGNAASGATTASETTTSAPETPAAATASPSEPTQDEKDALLKEATQFSQAHGHDALLAALQTVGAERFSAIPYAKYGDFRAAMAKTTAGASALS